MVTKQDAMEGAVQKASEMREVLRTFVSENGGDAGIYWANLEKTAAVMFNEAEGDAAVDFVTGNARARQALRLVMHTVALSDMVAVCGLISNIADEAREEKFDCSEYGYKMPQEVRIATVGCKENGERR